MVVEVGGPSFPANMGVAGCESKDDDRTRASWIKLTAILEERNGEGRLKDVRLAV
jgi:hypothetical protein